jgi:hypothetical protein
VVSTAQQPPPRAEHRLVGFEVASSAVAPLRLHESQLERSRRSAQRANNLGGADQQPKLFPPPQLVRLPGQVPPTAERRADRTLTTQQDKEARRHAAPDYVVDTSSRRRGRRAGASNGQVRSNRRRRFIQEVKARNVKAGEPITLVSEVKDDGIPKRRTPSLATLAAAQQRLASDPVLAAQIRNPSMSPPSRITVGKNLGLHVSWFVYRGPVGGKATFDPPQVKAWEDTRAGANSPWAPVWAAPKLPDDGLQPVQVTFSEPGTYVLRCRADDGALVADEEVTIVVVR